MSFCLFVYARVQRSKWCQIRFHNNVDNVNITKLFMDCTVVRSLYRWVLHSTGCFYVLRLYFYVCLLILLGACVGRHDKLVFASLFLSLRQTRAKTRSYNNALSSLHWVLMRVSASPAIGLFIADFVICAICNNVSLWSWASFIECKLFIEKEGGNSFFITWRCV